MVCLIAVCGTHRVPLGMLNGQPWLLKAFQHCKCTTMDLCCSLLGTEFTNLAKVQEDHLKGKSFDRGCSDSES